MNVVPAPPRSAMEHPFDRLVAITGRSAAQSPSFGRLILITLVVAVQIFLVVVIVLSTLGVGRERAAGNEAPPLPQPAGATVPRSVVPSAVPDGAGQAARQGGNARDPFRL